MPKSYRADRGMDMLLDILEDLMITPSIIISIVACIGLILQKKPVENIIAGTIRTGAGFLLLSAGSSMLQAGALNDFGILFNFAFHIHGVIPNMEAVASVALDGYAAQTTAVMCLGMLLNLVMARLSAFKYVFLTGQHTLYMACLITVVLAGFGLDGVSLVLCGALWLGFVMAFFPAIAQKETNRITGKTRVSLGHFSTAGYLLSAGAAYFAFGRKGRQNRSSEDIHFPKQLSFMRDTTVSISISMTVLFLIVSGIASTQEGFTALDIQYVSGGYNSWIVYSIVMGLEFAISIYVILSGVRMALAEIVPAFRGFADRIVPHAKPAIDCPVLFNYAPNAVMIGFFMSFLGGLVSMAAMYGINAAAGHEIIPIIIPGVVAHFFCGATAGIFGNAEGGLKGCMLGAFVQGIFISFLPIAIMPLTEVLNMSGTAFSDSDFCITGLVMGVLVRYFGKTGFVIISFVLFLLPIVWNKVVPKQKNS